MDGEGSAPVVSFDGVALSTVERVDARQGEMVLVDVTFQNSGFADKKIKVMIQPEDHFLKPCQNTSDYQAQGRLAGRNYVQTNNKGQFTLKKDQSGTLLLCGLSCKSIVPTSMILRLATDDETLLEKEFHITPRFQASTF